jgi:hypothetical protein
MLIFNAYFALFLVTASLRGYLARIESLADPDQL